METITHTHTTDNIRVFVFSSMAALAVFESATSNAHHTSTASHNIQTPPSTIWSLALLGKKQSQESFLECAHRTLKEQLGFQAWQINAHGTFVDETNHTTELFSVIWEDQIIVPNANIIRWQWCHADETPSFIADHNMDATCVEAYQYLLGS